jgi:6-pyruvoyltetrahydropterin/6-carboxytetrahydropterin synthase
MYEISAFGHFDAAHFLRGYAGKCANIHGHRWKVEITLVGAKLNKTGILIDFMEVRSMLKDILNVFDHKLINEVAPFDQLNPTAENLARFVFDEMSERLKYQTASNDRIARVTVWESEAASATYFE